MAIQAIPLVTLAGMRVAHGPQAWNQSSSLESVLKLGISPWNQSSSLESVLKLGISRPRFSLYDLPGLGVVVVCVGV